MEAMTRHPMQATAHKGAASLPPRRFPSIPRIAPYALAAAALICVSVLATTAEARKATSVVLKGNGLKHTRSAYSVDETVARIKDDVAQKGIMFFTTIDQSQLGKDAKIDLRPSQLVMFGNPPLGVLFLTSNPDSGMDWPVRVLVRQEADGKVVAVYQDWNWVATRYAITDRKAEFAKATDVVMSIISSIADCKVVADCTQ